MCVGGGGGGTGGMECGLTDVDIDVAIVSNGALVETDKHYTTPQVQFRHDKRHAIETPLLLYCSVFTSVSLSLPQSRQGKIEAGECEQVPFYISFYSSSLWGPFSAGVMCEVLKRSRPARMK